MWYIRSNRRTGTHGFHRGGRNENASHRLTYLNTRSQLVEHLGKIRRGGHIGGGVPLGAGFEISTLFTINSLWLPHVSGLSVSSQLLQCHVCLPAAMSLTITAIDSPSETKQPSHTFFYKFPWSWCLFIAMEKKTKTVKFSEPRPFSDPQASFPPRV